MLHVQGAEVIATSYSIEGQRVPLGNEKESPLPKFAGLWFLCEA